jgi:hypothetical protein
MLSISEYERLVQRLQGWAPPYQEAAAFFLLAEIRSIHWPTPEECSAAQSLVARLERLRQASPPPARGASPPP